MAGQREELIVAVANRKVNKLNQRFANFIQGMPEKRTNLSQSNTETKTGTDDRPAPAGLHGLRADLRQKEDASPALLG
jgi:hypothetical protein